MDAQKLILAIAGLQFLIVFHEWGHYWFAKRFGMRVSRFSVGFGPKLFGFSRGGTEFLLSAIPFGGYVQIDGMSSQDGTDRDDPAAYPNKPMWQRFLVVLMGPIANLVLAFVCFWLMLMAGFDKPDMSKAVLGGVRDGLPAAAAGLRPGDRLVTIAGRPVTSFADIPTFIADTSGPLVIEYERAGTLASVTVDPDHRAEPTFMRRLFRLDKPQRLLGVESPTEHIAGVSPLAALSGGVALTAERTLGTLAAFGQLFSGKAKGRLTGLPGIVKLIGGSIDKGFAAVLSLLAVLSINLFLFNLFPLPALDGGRLIFLGIEGVRRKPLNARFEEIFHGIGFLLLFGLILFVSLRDLFV